MSETNSKIRSYDPKTSVVFLKTTEKFGGLSNMAAGYPLEVNGIAIRTSEALYQALRFPHMPDLQRTIIDEVSPMTAKMRTKPHRENSREDWDRVRVRIMRWSLQVKLAQNLDKFGALLLSTGEAPIVEFSKKDQFWGAEPTDDGRLVGMNVLGRLLMELREQLQSNGADWFSRVEPLPIEHFELLRRDIGPVMSRRSAPADASPSRVVPRDLFSAPSPEPPQSITQQIAPTLADLTPYPEMKDTGLAWLPRIPSHWEMWRNGRLFAARRQTGFPDLPILEVSLRSGVRVRDMESGRKQQMADRSKYLRAKEGDIAYNMMRMWQGSVGVVPEDGLVSPAYVVATPFLEADPRYYAYLFRTVAYMGEVDAYSRGIVKDRNRLYWESFKQIFSAVPPREEQRLIVRFLNWHGGMTAKLIRAKRRTVELLEEHKQATILRVVSRGWEAESALAPVDVSWLQRAPENWSVIRLRQTVENVIGGVWGDEPDGIHDTACLRVADFDRRRLRVRTDEPTVRAIKPSEASQRVLRAGDLLVEKSGGGDNQSVGAIVLFDSDLRAVSSNFIARMRIAEGFVPQYLVYLHAALYASGVVRRHVKQTTGIQNLDLSAYLAERVVVPDETTQRESVRKLDDDCSRIERAQDAERRQIDLLRELRSRLVADVVTGQLDVRQHAATLPEENLEIEPIGDEGDVADDDNIEDVEDAA